MTLLYAVDYFLKNSKDAALEQEEQVTHRSVHPQGNQNEEEKM